ncbi:hypothetical protein CTI12_AA222640 [Artemisia annua]|uniref:RNA-directed DNA polymerase, eukaryota, Reverse transcriptase zinc-binding domain protein n=1 Tax=Artemisia annua TaxID=35608 RepID=A0A2U1NVA7_ARTAN|nr:hypothetical protein CTI12_AA222640 [Artemisia annua]
MHCNKLLFVDEDPSENNAIGRVCIKTRIHSQVNEICKVVILGKSFNVSVKEFAGWVPNIKSMESLSSLTDMDKLNKHDNDFSDSDPQDEEEGEIRNDNITQEDEFVKNTFWSDEAEDVHKKQDGNTKENQNPSSDQPEIPKEDSASISKPPGFERYKSSSPKFSTGDKHNSHKQTSNSSSAPAKSSRAISFLGIQETHSTKVDSLKVKCSWGNFQFEYAECPSSGRSGGLVSIWDPNIFSKTKVSSFEHILIVEDTQLNTTVTDFWAQHVPNVLCDNPIVSFKNKMKDLKHVIKAWSINRNNLQSREKEDLIKKIKDFDESVASRHIKTNGVWGRIIGSINTMHDKGYIPHSSIKRRVNSGTSTKFWHDTWISNTSLRNQFPRLYRLTTNKDILIRDCWNQGWNFSWSRNINSGTNAIQLATLHNMLSGITLSDSADVWVWCIKPPEFLVKNARKHIDNHYLPDGVWNRVLHWLDLSLPTISNIQDLLEPCPTLVRSFSSNYFQHPGSNYFINSIFSVFVSWIQSKTLLQMNDRKARMSTCGLDHLHNMMEIHKVAICWDAENSGATDRRPI